MLEFSVSHISCKESHQLQPEMLRATLDSLPDCCCLTYAVSSDLGASREFVCHPVSPRFFLKLQPHKPAASSLLTSATRLSRPCSLSEPSYLSSTLHCRAEGCSSATESATHLYSPHPSSTSSNPSALEASLHSAPASDSLELLPDPFLSINSFKPSPVCCPLWGPAIHPPTVTTFFCHETFTTRPAHSPHSEQEDDAGNFVRDNPTFLDSRYIRK